MSIPLFVCREHRLAYIGACPDCMAWAEFKRDAEAMALESFFLQGLVKRPSPELKCTTE